MFCRDEAVLTIDSGATCTALLETLIIGSSWQNVVVHHGGLCCTGVHGCRLAAPRQV